MLDCNHPSGSDPLVPIFSPTRGFGIPFSFGEETLPTARVGRGAAFLQRIDLFGSFCRNHSTFIEGCTGTVLPFFLRKPFHNGPALGRSSFNARLFYLLESVPSVT